MIKGKAGIAGIFGCPGGDKEVFGYIRTVPAELRMREYECYRACYCGLCRSMGKCTGACSRLTLSYDFVFLAAVRMWLAQEPVTTRRFRCALHPLKRRTAVTDSAQLDYCADASVLLSYHKCLDDRADERGFRRFRAGIAMLALRGGYRRARARHPALDSAIRQSLAQLSEYEKRPDAHSADEPAGLFGNLMAAVFSEGLEGACARIAADLGRGIGKWIYLVDAADDFDGDIRKHRFNPYRGVFGNSLTAENRQAIRLSLTEILQDTELAYDLFDSPACPELREIVSNILYLGMPRTADRILFPQHDNQKGART